MFTEKRIWSWLKADAPKHIFLQRLECTYPPGVPDVLCCCHGVVTFIELKRIVRERIKLRPQQILFIKNWISHQGRVFILGADEKKDIYLLFPTTELLSSGKIDFDRDLVYAFSKGKVIWSYFESVLN